MQGTSVLLVKYVVKAILKGVVLRSTTVLTQEKNHSVVRFVIRNLHRRAFCIAIYVYILERNHLCVKYVIKLSLEVCISNLIYVPTLVKNHSAVRYVTRGFHTNTTYKDIPVTILRMLYKTEEAFCVHEVII